MPYVLFGFVCLVWSVSFLLMKKAAWAFSPVEIAMGRVLGGTAILALIWLVQDRRWSLRRTDVWAVAIVVVAGCAWPYYIQPWVISRQGSAFMALMVSFVPLLTIGMSIALLGTRPNLRQSLGVLGALACLAVLMHDGLKREIPLAHIGYAFTVPLGYALANTVIRRWLPHVSALLLTGVSFALTACTLAPLIHAGATSLQPTDSQWTIAFWSLAGLGIVGTGLATFVFNHLVRQHGPLFAGMTTNVVPLGAIGWGWWDGEPISLAQAASMLGILSMVWLVQYRAASPIQRERKA
jgi:drug/metabolite transporter (DMT)-like permease